MSETLSQYLARTLASRLAGAVPSTVSVSPEGPNVLISVEGEPFTYVCLSDVIEQPGDTFEHIQHAAYSVLASVQDVVSQFVTRGPWPVSEKVRSPMPVVSISEDQLHLGYGQAELSALELPSVPLAWLDEVP